VGKDDHSKRQPTFNGDQLREAPAVHHRVAQVRRLDRRDRSVAVKLGPEHGGVPLAYLIGAVLAFGVSGIATLIGLDRDRAFYPTVLIVIASYYALFAVMGGSDHALGVETAVIAVFLAASIVGFKYSLWLVVAALAAHGVFDAVHDRLIANPGVPAWWPPFCLAYDVVAAGYLAYLLLRREVGAPKVTTHL
jgi:hypothetical protein